ncbi:MAG: cysteine desulfurase NifS [Lachnospiraceae bacterium]|nr:cysteine desulfurase NifS [Lachnospiraceae bacterium]
MNDFIYLDNAATTRVKEEVLEAMLPYFCESYGNPAAIYSPAGKAAKAVGLARQQVADVIGVKREEIYFTAGGSESDNWAIRGVYEMLSGKGNHIITTKVEHHAVINTCKYLEGLGAKVTYLSVDEYGMISLEELKAAISPQTILISVMAANNEVGTIMPLEQIGEIAREHKVLFHTDAVQAYGHIPLDAEKMHIDLLSASGHKLGGPKGIGFLYVKKGLKLPPLIYGGGQERGRRGGTLNVPGIVGMGCAAELALKAMNEQMKQVMYLRDCFAEKLLEEIPEAVLNGHPYNRLPGNVNVTIPGVEGESVLILLDQRGVCASSGSACSMAQEGPSHVLLAMGLTQEEARGAIRFSLSEENTEEELDKAVHVLKEIVVHLREIMLQKYT